MDALTLHRLQFGFTVAYHYIFPQLTMGLALLIVVLKVRALRGDAAAGAGVGFWSKIFGVSFALGVVTGIPLEFQFGTNWARFSEASGGVIGQTLAMEGVFAFFLEGTFLYFLLYGERWVGPRGHLVAAVLVCVGTWLSGFFVVCTNAFMQHPVNYRVDAAGVIHVDSLWSLLTNPWAWVQYAHTMVGSVITASFVMAALGAFYLLRGVHVEAAKRFVTLGVIVGFVSSVLSALPTGDLQAKLVYRHQPATFAAMEGHFHTESGAGLTLVGQPNLETLTLDNPITIPRALSFMTHARWDAEVHGLTEYPREDWPDNIALLYYSYHVMAGLGTLFMTLMGLSVWSLWRRRLFERRGLLWALMLAVPFPFIANTAGWMTAELGRQPWLIHGVMRTQDGSSLNVSAGNALFSLLGFMGLYTLTSMLYLFVIVRLIDKGPAPAATDAHANQGQRHGETAGDTSTTEEP